tara:strand:- start:546 stop:803 length:258 start_codon:yes stop_codon:yes gene_type:complete
MDVFYKSGSRVTQGIRTHQVNSSTTKVFFEDTHIGYISKSNKDNRVKYGAILWDAQEMKIKTAKPNFFVRTEALSWLSDHMDIVL